MSEFKMTINGEDYIAHYGVRGMKQGVRRWTNPDGSLNDAGKRRYNLNRNWNPASPKQELQSGREAEQQGKKFLINGPNNTIGYDERKKREKSAAESSKLTKTTNVQANYEENVRTAKGYTTKDRVKKSKKQLKAEHIAMKAKDKGRKIVDSIFSKLRKK